MKKLSIIVVMFLGVLLIACANGSADLKTSEIIGYTTVDGGMELKDESGKHYGVMIKDSTELVWKDKEMYIELVEEAKSLIASGEIEYEYNEWEFVTAGMLVEVELGDKAPSKLHLSNDLIVECHVAKKITVISLGETYVNPFTVTAGNL